MTRIAISQLIAGALFSLCLATVPARALNDHTYVSGKGVDKGGCTTPATACRTFAFATAQTAASGTIIAIDPANYGPVTITKSISIVADGGGPAGIFITAGNATTINAGASDSVQVRGLTIEGLGSGKRGIEFNTGGNLSIENCVIRDFTDTGIYIVPTVLAAVTGVLSNVTANNNGTGIFAFGFGTGTSLKVTLNVTIAYSEASNNQGFGIESAGVTTTVMVRNVVASYNGTGLAANNGSTLRVAHSVVTGNALGVEADILSRRILSYGDNDIDGNTNNNTGILVSILTH